MSFTVLIPARLASTRLPNKPLADIAGLPMVVRVAQRVAQGIPEVAVVVAADSPKIVQACSHHGVRALLTRVDHASGSDRLAEASALLQLAPEDIVVNVQGDEPLIDPQLVRAVADVLRQTPGADMGTAAHPLHTADDFHNPHVVKVVLAGDGRALYFSRAPIPYPRDAASALPATAPLRHIGLYAYRVGFLQRFPQLPPAPLEQAESLEQLRALWHGCRIQVHVTSSAPGPGVDTPQDLERVRALWARMA